MRLVIAALLLAAIPLTSVAPAHARGWAPSPTRFRLTAADFGPGRPIPAVHEGNAAGCTGRNTPPVLRWSGEPSGTRSFALTVIDPDAPVPGGFVHWIVYDIPASRHVLNGSTLRLSRQGRNSASVAGYTGPCPPPGSGTHHYHFTLYALSVPHIGPTGLGIRQFRHARVGKALATTQLIGTFRR